MSEGPEERLADHPFLEGLKPEWIETLAERVEERSVAEGVLIIQWGEPAGEFYLIREGVVSIELMSETQNRIPIETLGGGSCVGWSWLVPPYRWQFDARTLDSTELFVFNGEELRNLCRKKPGLGFWIARKLMAVVAERLSATRLRLLDLYGEGPLPDDLEALKERIQP